MASQAPCLSSPASIWGDFHHYEEQPSDGNRDKSHNSNTFSWGTLWPYGPCNWLFPAEEEREARLYPKQFLTLPRPNPSRVNIQSSRSTWDNIPKCRRPRDAVIACVWSLPLLLSNPAFVWHLHKGTSLLRQGLQNTSVTLAAHFKNQNRVWIISGMRETGGAEEMKLKESKGVYRVLHVERSAWLSSRRGNIWNQRENWVLGK